MDVAGKLEEIVRDLMADDRVPIRDRSWANCSQWDSLFQLNLLTSIEQEFEIRITDEEAAELTSFEAAVQLIEDRFKASVHATQV